MTTGWGLWIAGSPPSDLGFTRDPHHTMRTSATADVRWRPGMTRHMIRISRSLTSSHPRNRMKEGAADMASPAAGAAERLPTSVGKVKKGFIAARRDQRRIVEFV